MKKYIIGIGFLVLTAIPFSSAFGEIINGVSTYNQFSNDYYKTSNGGRARMSLRRAPVYNFGPRYQEDYNRRYGISEIITKKKPTYVAPKKVIESSFRKEAIERAEDIIEELQAIITELKELIHMFKYYED